MTGIRQSIVFSKEDVFGKGLGSGCVWVAPPPGTFFQSQHNRDVKRVQTTGSKFWDAQAYGQLSGSWSWTFTFDYDYLEPFYFAFESISRSNNVLTFKKENNKRVPSFTIRRKINNEMVGGTHNEITELTGCVVKEVSFQRNAATSKIDVSMSGFYANEALVAEEESGSDGWTTDYQEYSPVGGLVEYSCLFIGGMQKEGSEYMANTESISIRMENSAERVYSICTPFASNYYEGLTNITMSTTCYSTNPKQYKTRLYSGGYTNEPPTYGSSNTYVPMSKGMKPVPSMVLLCYNGTVRSDDPTYGDDTETNAPVVEPDVYTTFNNSNYSVAFILTQVVIKSLPWQKGDGGKLQDTLSSSDVQKLDMRVKTSTIVANSLANWFKTGGPHKVRVGNKDYTTKSFSRGDRA